MVFAMTEPAPLHRRAASALRRELDAGHRSIDDFAEALRIDRERASAVHAGVLPLTLDELDETASWLGVSRSRLLGGADSTATGDAPPPGSAA